MLSALRSERYVRRRATTVPMYPVVAQARQQDPHFAPAVAAFEAIGALDSKSVQLDGQVLPRQLGESRLLLKFVLELNPAPSKALLLACYCQHLGRYSFRRSEFPAGKDAYKAWRVEAARRSASQACEILSRLGYVEAVTSDVNEIVNKRKRATNPDSQTMEDALCLAFLHLDAGDFAQKHEQTEVIRILQRTWLKMSDAGHTLALTQPLDPGLRALLEQALAG